MTENLIECPVCKSGNFSVFLTSRDFFLTGETVSITRCSQCGFLFTNPRPTAGRLGMYYQSNDYISHSNSRKGLFNSIYQLVRNYTLKRKLALIRRYQSAGAVLDIGCATGQFLSVMKQNGWQATGIEPDRQTREYAVRQFGLDVFPEETLDTLHPESFDVITMWHVLEHVADLNKRLAQLKKLLKPGGTLVIAVPNSEARDAQHYGKFWAAYDLPRHLYHFSPGTMKHLLENYQFDVEEIRPMKFDAYYVSLLSEKYKNGKIRWIPGLWNGFCSNWQARGKNGYSSLIFVVKNKPA